MGISKESLAEHTDPVSSIRGETSDHVRNVWDGVGKISSFVASNVHHAGKNIVSILYSLITGKR